MSTMSMFEKYLKLYMWKLIFLLLRIRSVKPLKNSKVIKLLFKIIMCFLGKSVALSTALICVRNGYILYDPGRKFIVEDFEIIVF